MIEKILEAKRKEVRDLRGKRFGTRAKSVVPLSFEGGINIIAELKRKSPSAGFMAEIDSERINIYSRYARAISVLTDNTYFGGSPEFLKEVAYQTDLPVLFKDFILDPVQIDLAYAVGADLVLLIARILSKEELSSLYTHARELGLSCLVELHDLQEMDKLSNLKPPIVGANARNLDTLEMDLDKAAQILGMVSAPMKIAESGIKSRKDIERMSAANGFLIGETLMRSKDLEATFGELLHG
jgi:indole-3-glycerol phosphate synthase